MKRLILFIMLLISTLSYGHQSSLTSATINGTTVVLNSTACNTFKGGTLPISVTFKQISNYSGNVTLTVNVIITDKTTNTVTTVPNVFTMYNISTQFYTVALAPVTLDATHTYSFRFDAIVVYPNQSDTNANNKSSLNTCSTPLPVELVSFNGIVMHSTAKLSWVTASEKNSAYFTVESSINGTSFKKEGTVIAAGSSLQEINYSFNTDISGDTYYRLKSVDMDEHYEYSPVIILSAGLQTQYLVGFGERFVLFNLPAGDTPAKLLVMDMTGRVLYQMDATHILPHQAADMVIIQVVTKSGKSYNKRY